MAMYFNFLFCLQRSLAANSELTTALADKNKECRKLKWAIELKDGQIASLEEARKKDEGKDSLPSSYPTTCKLSICSDNQLRQQLYFFCRIIRYRPRDFKE